jgi:hypothetical protein
MKITSKLSGAAATLLILGSIGFSASQAVAFSDGQIEGGDIYRVEDLTTNSGFANPATANACDTLEYRARLYNPGSATLNNVNVQALVSNEKLTSNTSTLDATASNADPANTYAFATVNLSSAQTLSYVAGSTQLLDQNDNPISNLSDGITISGTGVNIGNLGPSVIEFVQFQEKVSCPTPPPPPTPTYTCNDLELTAEDNRTVKISTFTTTATNGASFKNAVITWGDSSSALTTANVVGQTHQYAADGTYTVSATAHFTVNGQDVTAGGPQCQKQVTFSSTTPPQVTPPPSTPPPPATPPAAPTALVNTGPGSVIGLFAAATAAGTVLYRRMLSRRLSRQ